MEPRFDNLIVISDDNDEISDDDREEYAQQRATKFVDMVAKKIPLSERDLYELTREVYIGDEVLNVAQASLKITYPDSHGLQDTVLGS